jgi:phage terminase large subunit-like protein
VKSTVSWDGSPPPTAATPRTDRATYGPALAETARVLGVPFMGWQQLVADRAMEHEAGRLVHREIDLSIDRQAGKSSLFLTAIIHRMLWRRGQWLTYTTASRLAGRRKLLRVWWPIIRSSPLGHMFNVTRGTGSETLECRNDSTLVLLSGDEASGHGDSIDASFLDEGWSLTAAAEQAVRPAMATRPNGQLWVASTAGTAKSTYWRAKVDAGRTAAELGVVDETCFVEWTAPPTIDVTDPATWPSFMPALGRTIKPETVAADLATMGLSEWKRAYCNMWADESLEGWKLIPRATWEASRL